MPRLELILITLTASNLLNVELGLSGVREYRVQRGVLWAALLPAALSLLKDSDTFGVRACSCK